MRSFTGALLIAAILAAPTPAQEVAPIFEQVPAVMYETFRNIDQPAFDEYFRMLVAKHTESGGHGWAIYRENAKVAHRITVLENGLESVPGIQAARVASFQEFNEEQMALWNSAWGTRQAVIYNSAPNLSYVPGGFGTLGQSVMIRVAAESLDADRAALAERMEIRQGYLDEFMRLTRIMDDASWHIESHDQTRVDGLSYPALSN
jgi:hypothetical protein